MAGYIWKGREIRAQLSMTGQGWSNLHPEMQRRAQAVIHDANEHFKPLGLSVGAYEGWRTSQRQLETINQGTSFLDSNDWLRSYHPWGLAVDFVFINRLGMWTWEPGATTNDQDQAWYDVVLQWVGVSDDPNKQLWHELGEIIERHGLEWGGRWGEWGSRKFDGPHGQLTAYGRTSGLIAKYETPNNVEWIA